MRAVFGNLFRVYFNDLKEITETIINNYFIKKYINHVLSKRTREWSYLPWTFLLSAWEEIVKISQCLLQQSHFWWYFLTYRPKVDYFDDYFKIVKQQQQKRQWGFSCEHIRESILNRFGIEIDVFISRKRKLVHFAFRQPLLSYTFSNELFIL